ncbi:MAG: hypothetical protein V3U49_00250 [Nitrososphaerales archaeon]
MQKPKLEFRENQHPRGKAVLTVMSVIGLSLIIPLVSAMLMNVVFLALIRTQVPSLTRGIISLFGWIVGFTLGTMAFWRLARSMAYTEELAK